MKRIFSIALLIIFTAGQVNLTYAKHFCGSFEMESTVSIGKTKLSCSIEKMSCCEEDSNQNSGPIVINNTCCSNDYYYSDADDFFDKSGNSINNQLLFASSFIISLFNFTKQNDESQIIVASSPFLIHADRQAMYQNFLL